MEQKQTLLKPQKFENVERNNAPYSIIPSFSFIGNIFQEVSPFTINLIPKEVWKCDILFYLDSKTKKRLRMTCKAFYYLVNDVTKWRIGSDKLKEYLGFYETNLEWKPNIYQINCYYKQ